MKLSARFRKVVKWGGLVVAVLLVLVWLGSGWYAAWLQPSIGGCVGVENGIAFFMLPHWQLNSHDWAFCFIQMPYYQLDWGLDWRSWIDGPVVSVPLWAPALTVIAVAAVAWWADARARRRERAGCCAKCNYNRAGLLPDSVCPECGGVVF